jgi:hypothetical protein
MGGIGGMPGKEGGLIVIGMAEVLERCTLQANIST